ERRRPARLGVDLDGTGRVALGDRAAVGDAGRGRVLVVRHTRRVGDCGVRAEAERAAGAVGDVDPGVPAVERGGAVEVVSAVGVVELKPGPTGGGECAGLEGNGTGG